MEVDKFLEQFEYHNIFNGMKQIVKDGKAGLREMDAEYDQAFLFLWKHKMGLNYQQPRLS